MDLGGDVVPCEQLGDAFDAPAAEVAADVVGVVVRDEHPGHAHAVSADHLDQLVDAVGGIDDDGIAGLAIADGVGEVDHMPRDRIVTRKVASREQLAEVQLTVRHEDRTRERARPRSVA